MLYKIIETIRQPEEVENNNNSNTFIIKVMNIG